MVFNETRTQANFFKNRSTRNKEVPFVIRPTLNPILKKSGLPELKIKIGMDYGEAIVVLYGNDVTNSHVDLIGPSLNIGAKIQNLASPDQILIGEEVYARLHNSLKQYFLKLKMDKDTWNYKQGGSKKIYPVYAYAGKQNHS